MPFNLNGQPARDRTIAGPHLTALMHSIGLDVAYHRAAADSLFYKDASGREVEVIDLVGGYGTLLLGHHHPALVCELTRFLTDGRPVHAQGSLRPLTEQFAWALNQRCGGGHQVVLASTGTEAVEAALKHAMLATGGNTFISLEGAFHGKSLATLAIAGNAVHRDSYQALERTNPNVQRVRLNDLAHLETVFAALNRSSVATGNDRSPKVAGFIFEPIQGEGGVHPMSVEFAHRAAKLCDQHQIPMIADECQTGTGRTGTFLACEGLGIKPDYIILSKALGGGLVKIAAVLIREDRYCGEFDLKQSSTYSGDELSCAVGLKVLELTDEALLARVGELGAHWLTGLHGLAGDYPDVIAGVRGSGLMLAVELRPLVTSPSFLLRAFSATDDLALLAAGFLLCDHSIRVAPTLSCPRTLRIQPSVLTSEPKVEQVIESLRSFCERVRCADAPTLTDHFSRPDSRSPQRLQSLRKEFKFCSYHPVSLVDRATDRIRRVAWLCHMIDNDGLVHLEPSFGNRSDEQRERLLSRLAPLANPVVLSEVLVGSPTGQSVRLYPILLPVTSAWIKRCMDEGMVDAVTSIVQKAIDLAEHLGCDLAALGQYTSIVTAGGLRLDRGSIGLCTGNSYSLSLSLDAIAHAEQQRGIVPARATCAVIGAGGNIGHAAAQLLSSHYGKTLLLGSTRPGSADRLKRLAATIRNAEVIDQPLGLRQADVILAASSAVDRPIRSEHLRHRAVICDLSVPSILNEGLGDSRHDLMVIKGGIVKLPFEEDLSIVGFPLEKGRTYGCMGEALLLGFENRCDRHFTGRVRVDGVRYLSALGHRHGFEIDQYKEHCVLGTHRRKDLHAGIT